MKEFYLSVPDELYNDLLGNFIEEELKMECGSVGCGTTDFFSKKKPKGFKNKILKNFGMITYANLAFRELESEEDQNNDS